MKMFTCNSVVRASRDEFIRRWNDRIKMALFFDRLSSVAVAAFSFRRHCSEVSRKVLSQDEMIWFLESMCKAEVTNKHTKHTLNVPETNFSSNTFFHSSANKAASALKMVTCKYTGMCSASKNCWTCFSTFALAGNFMEHTTYSWPTEKRRVTEQAEGHSRGSSAPVRWLSPANDDNSCILLQRSLQKWSTTWKIVVVASNVPVNKTMGCKHC